MSAKPTSHSELIEPLQNFLEAFTQELTEQKFVPAFRDELKRLLGALESLQQSEDSLQQIARGVERLREVFAPAGTRLLENVKDLETVLRGQVDQIKEQTDGVLKDLFQTHEQLESALRSEAGLLKEQTAAGREALVRASADVEQRIGLLMSQMDTLTRRLETEKTAIESAMPVATASLQSSSSSVASTAWPEELRTLISRNEQVIRQELGRYQEEVADLLTQGRTNDSERLSRLDHKLNDAIQSFGPRIQDELDGAVTRLRDQIQTLILAEIETRALRPTDGGATAASVPADISTVLAASETRILREISTLQKTSRGELGSDRILKDLTSGMEEAAQIYTDRLTEESQKIRESLSSLQRMFGQMRESDQQSREQINLINNNVDTLVKIQREQSHLIDEQLRAAMGKLDLQGRALEQRTEEDRQHLSQLTTAFARVEQATTSATELTISDSRAQRDRIEAGIKDLRERMERGITSDAERTADMLRQIAESWTEALETLRDFVTKTIAGRTDSILARLEGIETRLSESGQSSGTVQRDLQNEIKRAGTLFDERVQTLKSETESFVAAIETHIKAVSGEVSSLRSKQDQSLAVLKEAIRANYDENASRLKEVVESVYDHYIKQTTSVPQALERVVHLVQSLSQGDQLALQTISSDTKNLVSLSTEKFETLITDNTAMKKYFPLLNQRLEKHSAELEMVRKSQVRQDKDVASLQQLVSENRDAQDSHNRELRDDMTTLQEQHTEYFEVIKEDLGTLKSELASFQDEHLPNFRREVSTLLASKFEFVESTLHERQEALRKELAERQEIERAASRKNFLIVAGLVALSILAQIVFHFSQTPGAGK